MFRRLGPKSKFSRDVLILMSGTSLAQAIPIAISPILTRLYSPEDFGVFALYTAIIGIGAAIATGRYELAILLPSKDEEADSLVVLSFYLSITFSVFLLFVAFTFGADIANYLGNPEIAPWLYFLPLSIFLTSMYNTLNYWLNRKERYSTMSKSRVGQSGTTGAINILLGSTGMGVGGMIASSIAGQVSIVAVLTRSFTTPNRKIYLNWPSAKTLLHRYRSHPLHLMPAHWIGAWAIQMPILIITAVSGAAAVGYYSLAFRLITMPTHLVANAIGDVYRQQATSIHRKNGEFRALFLETLLKSVKIGVLPFAILYFIAPGLFAFVFGEPWRVAGEFSQIIVLSAFFQFVFTPIDKGALVVGATKFIFYWHALRLTLLATLFVFCLFVETSTESIIWSITIINILLYSIDGVMEYRYSCRGKT